MALLARPHAVLPVLHPLEAEGAVAAGRRLAAGPAAAAGEEHHLRPRHRRPLGVDHPPRHLRPAGQPDVEAVLPGADVELADAAAPLVVLGGDRARAGGEAVEHVPAVAVGRGIGGDAEGYATLRSSTGSHERAGDRAALAVHDPPFDRRPRRQHQLEVGDVLARHRLHARELRRLASHGAGGDAQRPGLDVGRRGSAPRRRSWRGRRGSSRSSRRAAARP